MSRARWVSLAALLTFTIFSSAAEIDMEVRQTGNSFADPALSPHQQLARAIFKELIEINTTDSTGSTTQAAEAMAARLHTAGFSEAEVRVLGPHPRKGNLVARLRGKGIGKPILLLAHLDVVEARREDWSFDPFKFLERDNYFYGRGTNDIKSGAALLVANFIRLKQEGFVPNQDLVLALTADGKGAAITAWIGCSRISANSSTRTTV